MYHPTLGSRIIKKKSRFWPWLEGLTANVLRTFQVVSSWPRGGGCSTAGTRLGEVPAAHGHLPHCSFHRVRGGLPSEVLMIKTSTSQRCESVHQRSIRGGVATIREGEGPSLHVSPCDEPELVLSLRERERESESERKREREAGPGRRQESGQRDAFTSSTHPRSEVGGG